MFSTATKAMPMFARKYKVDCTMCHSAVPRLNFTGYKFKSAGYRQPWEVGKDQPESAMALENYNSFMAVMAANDQITSNAQAPGVASVNLQEVDLHALTGSWGKSWSSRFEADALTDGTVNVNTGFGGYTVGNTDSFWTLQGGVFPNFLGFGTFDRPLAISFPLILTTSASNPNIDTLFGFVSPRAAGVTGLYWQDDTVLSVSVRNRLSSSSGTLDSLGSPRSQRFGDVLISLTQFFDRSAGGSALGLAYYKGQSKINTAAGATSLYPNNFNHVIGSVNYFITEKINTYVGAGWGQDQLIDSTTNLINQKLYSNGSYAGLEYFFSGVMAAGARFDYFRTDLNTSGTELKEETFYLNYRPINQIIFATEYQIMQNGVSTSTPGLVQSVLTAQATFIY
jgi:hypothetical protein